MTKPVAAGRSLYLHSNSLRRYLCGFGSRGLASSSRGGEGIVGIKKQRVDEKDRHEFLDSTLRSSHAAEIGMNSFLEGQRFIENAHSLCFRGQSRDSSSSAVDRRDFASSNVDEFQRWISERRIRPSLVQPFFHLGGFALGAISTLGGNHTASLVRSAIRDSVSTSYNDRIRDAVEKGFGDDRSLINVILTQRSFTAWPLCIKIFVWLVSQGQSRPSSQFFGVFSGCTRR